MNFVTLFDSYYLDKALCMYRSLENKCKDFKLFIFCFDDKSEEILKQENLKHVTILSSRDLEDRYQELKNIKKERSKAEYCWTCTPATIEYVLDKYDVEDCIYIDADLYFFGDPLILQKEINEAKADIVVTPHRFDNSLRDRRFLKRSGKYCVEFNYFNQTDNARQCLKWWREKCFEWCYHIYEADRMGDQKYLMSFDKLFQGVHELQHIGGGVAPWNLRQYEIVDDSLENGLTIREKATGNIYPIVFYHFQNIRYINEHKVNISSETHSKKTKKAIYLPYLRKILSTRRYLKEKYNLEFSLKKIYASNPIIGLLQGTILRFRIKSISDVIDLRKI